MRFSPRDDLLSETSPVKRHRGEPGHTYGTHGTHPGARGQTDLTDEPHNHPPKPNDTNPHENRDRLNSRKNIAASPESTAPGSPRAAADFAGEKDVRFVWGAFVSCCFACGCVLELVVCRVRFARASCLSAGRFWVRQQEKVDSDEKALKPRHRERGVLRSPTDLTAVLSRDADHGRHVRA